MAVNDPLHNRFWPKVDVRGPAECWPWTANHNRPGGYGMFWVAGRGSGIATVAHRVAYELCTGKIPEGLKVLHTCDNPSCVNPAHLFLGTMADNSADMHAKGRGANLGGEKHPMAKLSVTQVRAIRKSTAPQRKVAAQYEISQAQVWRIRHGESWA